jgi:hypothetical protein
MAFDVKRAWQIEVVTSARPGTLGSVLNSLATGGADISGVVSYNRGASGCVQIIPHDADRAEQALRHAGYATERKEVLIVEADDKPGAMADIGRRLGRAGVDIEYLYATSVGGGRFMSVFQTREPAKAYEALCAGP